MEPSVQLSVVVPAFREGSRLDGSLRRLSDALRDADLLDTAEVIVVSDGSDDDTAAVARRFATAHPGQRVHVIEEAVNRGKGYALRTGARAATGDHLVFIDADMDLDPHGIAHLLAQMEAEDADIVVGSKIHPRSNVAWPLARRVQSSGYRLLVRTLFELSVRDTQTGLKVMRRSRVAPILDEIDTDGFAFDLDLLVRANDAGAVVMEGPVTLLDHSASSTSVRSATKVLRETLRLAAARRRRVRSAR
jgi:glycosyltransferase involved in cell wall biosynthesis